MPNNPLNIENLTLPSARLSVYMHLCNNNLGYPISKQNLLVVLPRTRSDLQMPQIEHILPRPSSQPFATTINILQTQERYSSLTRINRPREPTSFPGLACRIVVTTRNPCLIAGIPLAGMACRPASQSTTTNSPLSVVQSTRSLPWTSKAGELGKTLDSKSALSGCVRENGAAERMVQSKGR